MIPCQMLRPQSVTQKKASTTPWGYWSLGALGESRYNRLIDSMLSEPRV